MTRTKARVKKQRVIKMNTIIFPAEFNPRVPDVNATIKRHEHILQYNTVLKELFPSNSFIVANDREKRLRELAARADPCNIKVDLLSQTEHGYKKCGRKCFATGTEFKICRYSTCNMKNIIYLKHTVKSVINKVLDLVSNGNHD